MLGGSGVLERGFQVPGEHLIEGLIFRFRRRGLATKCIGAVRPSGTAGICQVVVRTAPQSPSPVLVGRQLRVLDVPAGRQFHQPGWREGLGEITTASNTLFAPFRGI